MVWRDGSCGLRNTDLYRRGEGNNGKTAKTGIEQKGAKAAKGWASGQGHAALRAANARRDGVEGQADVQRSFTFQEPARPQRIGTACLRSGVFAGLTLVQSRRVGVPPTCSRGERKREGTRLGDFAQHVQADGTPARRRRAAPFIAKSLLSPARKHLLAAIAAGAPPVSQARPCKNLLSSDPQNPRNHPVTRPHESENFQLPPFHLRLRLPLCFLRFLLFVSAFVSFATFCKNLSFPPPNPGARSSSPAP